METHFSVQQRSSPVLQEIETILQRCVRCGLCTATCPTYLLSGDERDSPRGRIYLIKDMLENERTPVPEIRTHIGHCLSCFSCMTTCPSGVDYMHLVNFARAYIEEKSQRSLKERFARKLLLCVLPFPSRFRWLLRFSWLTKPFRGLLGKLHMKRLSAMLITAATMRPKHNKLQNDTTLPETTSQRQARVALLTGCAQSVVRPQINKAAVHLLRSQGVEVVLPKGEECCGGISHQLGHDEEAREFARRNILAWERAALAAPLDAILTTTSGCGTEMKDYGHLLRDDPAYARRAETISAYIADITEFLLDRIDLGVPEGWSDIRVAYHASCSLLHGQGAGDTPHQLLREAGFSVVEIPESHICCGAGAAYNVMQSDISQELRKRKLANIARIEADCVATTNVSCLMHLRGDRLPVVHVVELLSWAYGGACPSELKHLSDRVRSMQEVLRGKALVPVEKI
jgi:glycolate oxidase iron-sulfur subunit